MPYRDIFWRDIFWNEEPGGNVGHIAEHGLTPEDVEGVVFNPVAKEESRSSGLPIVYGLTSDGRYILVVYEEIGFIRIKRAFP